MDRGGQGGGTVFLSEFSNAVPIVFPLRGGAGSREVASPPRGAGWSSENPTQLCAVDVLVGVFRVLV